MPPPVVLWRDAHLLVAVKPAGLLSVAGRGPEGQDCLHHRLLPRWPDARVVHRLDMGTSGLMLFACSDAAQRRLSMAFERRQVDKRYVAVADGHLAPADGDGGWGRIELPLGADWPARPRQRVDHAHGKPSLTRWKVLAHGHLPDGRPVTRLLLAPVTGRSHQLRVHLAAIGHPLLGDPLYASPAVEAAAPRLMLHASALALPHPAVALRLALDSRPPF
ncbi:RluA family pseudouridine synthase [Aquabacterium sp. J223]|uniref:RluA family pseudouridine synthase n=1 Tax=Aquabacterium sp. J223 TaxID=2898431 RepID=UPI0021AE1EA8|nr:RluA family pseudouridine synthase [Aquabacterium sp. J223]UUX93959.1 RluA family pseudouridine synthase [Aquabacterium sp. J223]